jgi:hypothetical protein
MRSHPALDRPLVAAIVRLARKHRPEDLKELGMRLAELRFMGRSGFSFLQEHPYDPEEAAFRWLALTREQRNWHFGRNGGFLPATWIADWLTELLRKASRTGEVRPVDGPDAVMDSIEFHDGQILRAMRVDFVEDEQKPASRTLNESSYKKTTTKSDVERTYRDHVKTWRKEHEGRYPSREETYAHFAGAVTYRRIRELRTGNPEKVKRGGRPQKFGQ